MMVAKKRKILDRLRDKYKLVVLNDETFEEKASVTLNRFGMWVAFCVLFVLFMVLTTALVALTPLKEYIPGYADPDLRRDLIQAAYRADSLEAVLNARDTYLSTIRHIINDDSIGSEPGHANVSPVPQSRPGPETPITLQASEADSAFRKYIEHQESYDINPARSADKVRSVLSDYAFFPPVKGMITAPFDPGGQHYAVDVACKKDESIKAVLDGTVLFAGFTSETGHVIAIQHESNLVSLYKHCSVSFKKAGNYVKSGEVVGIVGNTGELTSGPHLHFELWHNGSPVDPEKLIRF